MRPRLDPHLDSRSTARQFDLFMAAEQVLPQWQTLSEEVRQALTSLLTRLILEHASVDHPPQSEEERP